MMLCAYILSVVLAGYLSVKWRIQEFKKITILDIFPLLFITIISPIGIGIYIDKYGTDYVLWEEKKGGSE